MSKENFEKAANRKQNGIVRELLGLLKHNKKWWLIPVILSILLIYNYRWIWLQILIIVDERF